MTEKILLSSPHMSDEGYEQGYINEAFATNWIAPLGENVNKFEEELASYVGIGHAAALSSGTAALHLALKAAGVGRGDVVFCQSLTFSATANPIIYQNATPVFIDSEPNTWNISITSLKEAFQKYRPKAVIVVHLYGLSARMDEIVALCKENNTILIEDAAESLGSRYKGVHTGTMGDYGIYSFNGNKIITTSGGGMLVSNDEERISKTRFWATQSRDLAPHYQHSEIGYNYRLSNILAGIGRGQLKVLENRVTKKREIFNFYKRELKDIEGVEFPPNNEWDYSNHWLTVVLFKGELTPGKVMEELAKHNIESRPLWKPMHLQPIFDKYDFIGDGYSEELFNFGVCLPSDSKMTQKQLEKVCKKLKRAACK